MPFPFVYVCDLLQRLDDNQRARSGQTNGSRIVESWFEQHRSRLLQDNFFVGPLLSTLLPERRSDRVYNIQARTLQKIFSRALLLGRSRLQELARWDTPGAGVDLADCVEGILKSTPNPPPVSETRVTVEEIDNILQKIAAECRFSAPRVRAARHSRMASSCPVNRELELGELYRKLSARDAKWLTRLVLKNYLPVVMDPFTVYRACHPLLPAILKVQDDFDVASKFLQSLYRSQGTMGGRLSRQEVVAQLKPALGVKVGRQPWIKARSIKHCLEMSHGRMSCEEKVDGEYCQIHVNLSKGRDCIQIFSKTGKDSTWDRVGVHDAIRASLRIGQASCPLKEGCILEGELVVYSDRDERVLDFHKIRKHVSRSGRFIGTEQDSPRHFWEHLMIVYYDVLLIDDQSLLSAKRSDRFLRLENLVTCVKGRSALVNHEVIDCGDRNAASRLRLAFAKCISAHREGLVLKPDDPYFDLSTTRRPYGSCCIKLKKEYIGSFGDVGDFAVVGARYDAAMAKSYQMPNIKWTHFYIGCLENRDEVQRWGLPPRFIVTNVVQLNPSQMRFFINHVNPPCLPATENERLLFRIAPGIDNGRSPSVVFTNPPVFDIRCFSFDRGGNTGFWSLRFPMVNKVHCDRSFQDTVSFSELQDIAEAEKKMPPPTDSQELLGLIAALEQAEPGARAVYLESQSTASRASTGMASPILSSPESQIAQPTSLLHELEPDSASTEQVLPILATYSTAMGPMTPPRSSAAVGCLGTEDSLRDVVTDDAGAVERSRKRAVEPAGTPRHPKMRKFATHPTRPAGGAVAGPSPRPGRTPLLDTEPNSQSQERPGTSQGRVQFSHTTSRETHEKELFFQRSVLDEDISVRTRQIVSTGAASQGFAFNTRSSRVPGRGDRGLSSHRAHECIYCPTTCQLRRMSILLSPCISKYAWITEDLLPAHGTMHVVSNAAAWKRAPFTSSSPNASKGGSSMVTQGDVLQSRMTKTLRRKKKVILVESRRKAATDQFLKEVEKVDLTLASGEREYVPVFDWRVLEVLTEVEARCSRGGERQDACFNKKEFEGIWKRHWVGLA